jgi:twinkle protein
VEFNYDQLPKRPVTHKTQCPQCASKGGDTHQDNLIWYEGDTAHCFACNYHVYSNGTTDTVMSDILKIPGDSKMDAARGTTLDTNKKYRITNFFNNNTEYKIYPYFDGDGSLVGLKYRGIKDKSFRYEGNSNDACLFGEHLFKAGGKYITITEGEEDAAAAYQMMGSRWPAVSIRTGAAGALRDIKKSFEFVDSFEKVVLCFDNDEPGKAAAKQVAQLFSPGKVLIVNLELKDAGEYLQSGKTGEFMDLWWKAKEYTPDGIINAKNLWDDIVRDENIKSVDYPWACLNTYTYGFRQQELVTITSGSGMGKSSIMRELEHHLLRTTDDNIGILALEESTKRTALGIMSVEANQLLHLPDTVVSDDEKRQYFDNTLGTGRVFLYDHFGSTAEENLLNRVRYMAKALDCKWIIIDHISIVVSGMDGDNERQLIDRLMTSLRTLVQETGVGMFLVSHLRRPTGDKGHERGAEVSLNQLRGSHAIAQLSDIVLGLERDQQHEDEERRNTTLIRVIKNRFTGLTGPACWLKYDKLTGRMHETQRPDDEGSDF